MVSLEDSKMVAGERKQKACFLKYNLGETLQIHLTGKTTKKRQNFDSSTPPRLRIASPLHIKWRNQEGPPHHRQMAVPRQLGKTQTTR
jgi:hypothetical protein